MSDRSSLPPTGNTARRVEFRAVVESFAHLLFNFGDDLTAALEEAARDHSAAGEAFHRIAAAGERLRRTSEREGAAACAERSCDQISEALDAAVIALQYQDRLTQRVKHICAGLHHLQELLMDGADRANEEWLAVLSRLEEEHRAEQARLAAQSTSRSECELF